MRRIRSLPDCSKNICVNLKWATLWGNFYHFCNFYQLVIRTEYQ